MRRFAGRGENAFRFAHQWTESSGQKSHNRISHRLIAFAAAGFLYIAVADLIPNLHRRFAIKDALSQVALIAIGVAIVTFAGHGH